MFITGFSLLILLANWLGLSEPHGIYMSVAEISISKGNSQINLKLKTFPDDLENVLRLFEKNKYRAADMCSKKKSILAYFSKNLGFKVDQQPVHLKWAGCKKIGDALELSFYTSLESTGRKIALKATFFTELFPTQQNIIQIKFMDDSPVYLKFKEGDPWQTVSFPVK
jgi:hypothetical protein